MLQYFVYVLILFLLGCQYQCKWLAGKTRLVMTCVAGDVKPSCYSLTHLASDVCFWCVDTSTLSVPVTACQRNNNLVHFQYFLVFRFRLLVIQVSSVIGSCSVCVRERFSLCGLHVYFSTCCNIGAYVILEIIQGRKNWIQRSNQHTESNVRQWKLKELDKKDFVGLC